MNRIGIIIEREFTERVHKKSFVISTLLSPVLLILAMCAPVLLNSSGPSAQDLQDMGNDGASMLLGTVFGVLSYTVIIVYGQQVMQSVIEEKQTRVLDVILTSCSPFELMMGKIFGLALVAALQVVIWSILVVAAKNAFLPAGYDMNAGGISLMMVVYVIGGFLFYASMYAAIGSAVDTPQDAAQFNIVIMLPIMISFMLLTVILTNPDSQLAVWCSIIPFTSPIVMMIRVPAGAPVWQIISSLVILYGTFPVMTWLASRIFRIGVFMHGKKPTWSDLGKWITLE